MPCSGRDYRSPIKAIAEDRETSIKTDLQTKQPTYPHHTPPQYMVNPAPSESLEKLLKWTTAPAPFIPSAPGTASESAEIGVLERV